MQLQLTGLTACIGLQWRKEAYINTGRSRHGEAEVARVQWQRKSMRDGGARADRDRMGVAGAVSGRMGMGG
jgi:hypothetical protein